MKPNTEKAGCLIRCHGEHCSSSQCCSKEKFIEDSCSDLSTKQQVQSINKKLEKKQVIPASTNIDLKRFTIYDEEGSKSCQSNENLPGGSSCQQIDEDTYNNKDKAIDNSLYAINVVNVNDGNCVSCITSHDEQNIEIVS